MHPREADCGSRPALLEWALTLAFLAVVATPFVGQLAGKSDVALIPVLEWRTPNPAPTRPTTAKALAEWPKALERWLNDAFGFRFTFVALNQQLVATLGTTSSADVTLGRDGWLFHRRDRGVDIEAEHRGAVAISDEEVERSVQRLVDQSEWLAAQGIPMIAALVPDKQSVYPEYLPAWARPSRPTRTDRVVAALKAAPQLRFVDTRPAFVAAKERQPQPLYYLTDTHWNHRGAYVAYRAIMAKVRTVFPDAHVVGPRAFKLTEERVGSLDLLRKHNFRWGWVEPKTEVVLNNRSHVVAAWTLVEQGWRPSQASDAFVESRTVAVRTNLAAAPRVLVLRDSFTNALAPFFNESFKELLYSHAEGGRNLKHVNDFAPDLVLSVFLEKALAFRVQAWTPPAQGASGVPWAEQLVQWPVVPPTAGADAKPVFADGFDAGAAAAWNKVRE